MGLKTIDYIIVGQGIAGSCIALQLLFRRKRILVIDRFSRNTATQVAAGLFNPITGKKLSKSWMADQLFPYLHEFYQQAEAYTGRHFFHSMPVYRPFVSVEEQNAWMGKSVDREFENFIASIFTSPQFTEQVNNPLGGLLLKQCGYIDTNNFVRAVKETILRENFFLEESFSEEELKFEDNSVRFRQWKAHKIIYCTGIGIKASRYFNWLPVQPLKGEILTIETEARVSKIYNRGVYVVPHVWKVGATYNFADTAEGVTENGKTELTNALNELINFPFRITGQCWGFRPTVPDRRPLIGRQPEIKNLIIFNGLGTKGVSLAPYFSEVLVNWMENSRQLNDAVGIERYKSLYSKSA